MSVWRCSPRNRWSSVAGRVVLAVYLVVMLVLGVIEYAFAQPPVLEGEPRIEQYDVVGLDINGDGWDDTIATYQRWLLVPLCTDEPCTPSYIWEFDNQQSGAYTCNGFDYPTQGQDCWVLAHVGQCEDLMVADMDGVPGAEVYAYCQRFNTWSWEFVIKQEPGDEQAPLVVGSYMQPNAGHVDWIGEWRFTVNKDKQWYIDHGVAMPVCDVEVRIAGDPSNIRHTGSYQVIPPGYVCAPTPAPGSGDCASMDNQAGEATITIRSTWRDYAGPRQWRVRCGGGPWSRWSSMRSLGLHLGEDSEPTAADADINGDGVINTQDLSILRQYWYQRVE